MLKFSQWKPYNRIEYNYQLALLNLLDGFHKMLLRYDITNPNEMIPFLQKYCSTDFFMDLASTAASRMITGLMVANTQTWKEAASKSMRGKMIYQSLKNEMNGPVGFHVKQLIAHNAQLIRTFPDAIAKQVNNYIAEESLKGKRSSEITKQLIKQFPEVANSRIKLIARTETSKATTELTRARAENLGLHWYVWKSSKDQRVRPAHKLMDGVLFNWNDPPNPEALSKGKEKPYGNYAPGSTFNCRCYPAPMIGVEDISWPTKVHINGKIKTMTLVRFLAFNGAERKAA